MFVIVELKIAMFSPFDGNKCSSRGPEAPGISGVPHGALGSSLAQVYYSDSTRTRAENEHMHNHTHTHANINTPPTPHTPHAV